MTSAASVYGSMSPGQGEGRGSNPTAALRQIRVQPIPVAVARTLLQHNHYLRSFPAGTLLQFGVFLNSRILGTMTFGVGPALVHSLVDGATPDDCITPA